MNYYTIAPAATDTQTKQRQCLSMLFFWFFHMLLNNLGGTQRISKNLDGFCIHTCTHTIH